MEKVESIMKTLETDPNKEKTDSVVEVAPTVQTNATEDEIDVLVTKIVENSGLNRENVFVVEDHDRSISDTAEDNRKEVEVPLEVAREISEANVCDDKIDDIENAFEKSMDVEKKDAGVYKSKVVVLRNVGGSSTTNLGKVTPALPKRSVKLLAYLRSPFFAIFWI